MGARACDSRCGEEGLALARSKVWWDGDDTLADRLLDVILGSMLCIGEEHSVQHLWREGFFVGPHDFACAAPFVGDYRMRKVMGTVGVLSIMRHSKQLSHMCKCLVRPSHCRLSNMTRAVRCRIREKDRV